MKWSDFVATASFNSRFARIAAISALLVAPPATITCASNAGAAGPSYRITKEIPLGGPDGWDFLHYSSLDRRVYVAHGDRVTVVDEPTGKVVGEVGPLPGKVHDITISPDTRQGFTDEGEPGVAIAFDLMTLKPTKRVMAAPDADGLLYDPATGRIFVVNGDSGSITVIDPSSDTAIATIDVGEKLEPAVSDGRGHIYVNGEEKNEIVEIDARANKVLARWPMSACRTPHGIAIDEDSARIFSTCANKVMVVTNADTGATVATIAIGEHSDGAAFDPMRKLAFSSNGDGTLSVVKELSPNEFALFDTVTTRQSARTMSIDPKTGRLFLVAGSVQSEKPADEPGKPRRTVIAPGSVELLYLDPAS